MEEKYLVVEVHNGLYVESYSDVNQNSYYNKSLEDYMFVFTTDVKKAKKFDNKSNTYKGSDASMIKQLLKGNYIVYTIKHEIVEGIE